MNAYWFNVIITLWLVAALPGVSATKICYNSFGTLVCRNRLPVQARIGIWVAFLLLLVFIIIGAIYWQRRRASRRRDSITTVEANQIDGPPPTPFAYPIPDYYPHGPRTAGVSQSAYSNGITPTRKANILKQHRDSYSSASQYSNSPEDDVLRAPPSLPASTGGFRLGLPTNPRPAAKNGSAVEKKAVVEPTPRDKNTRFILPEIARNTAKKERREWQVRLEALRSAPVKKYGFEVPNVPEAPTHSRSAGVAGALSSKIRPLFTGTGRKKEFN